VGVGSEAEACGAAGERGGDRGRGREQQVAAGQRKRGGGGAVVGGRVM
jgi:hypothetical protein